MNRKYLFAGLVSFAALPCFGEVPMEISLLMKDGEFAKTDSVIGKSGVSLTAVEADSLRAIMSRIERDFCYTFEEGVDTGTFSACVCRQCERLGNTQLC